MKWTNLDGLEPEKMSKDELCANIIEPIDILVAEDCLKYLITIDLSTAVNTVEKILSFPKSSQYFIDYFDRGYFFTQLSQLDNDSTIKFIKNNYNSEDCEILLSMVIVAMNLDKDKSAEIRILLRNYLEEKKNDKEFWVDRTEFPIWDNYVFIKEFLDEIKKDDSAIS